MFLYAKHVAFYAATADKTILYSQLTQAKRASAQAYIVAPLCNLEQGHNIRQPVRTDKQCCMILRYTPSSLSPSNIVIDNSNIALYQIR